MAVIMICGSRKRTPKMADYATRCVARAKETGDSIIVGDAHGIDADVVSACYRLDVPYTCYGISAEPRNYAPVYVNTQLADYTARDNHLIALADKVMCIWNAESKGTVNIYVQATKARKQAWLAIFYPPDAPVDLIENDTETPWFWRFPTPKDRDVYIRQVIKKWEAEHGQ